MTVWLPHVGAHSVNWLFAHIVWATRSRHPSIERALDCSLERALSKLARAQGASIHAYGAFDDHVHVLVQLPPELGVAVLVNRIKGASSNDFSRSGIRWQAGYWAESVSRSALARCSRYVSDQRRRHAAGLHDEPWNRADVRDGWSPPSSAGLEAPIALRAPAFRPGENTAEAPGLAHASSRFEDTP
jgi:putative transposase